MGLRQQWEDLDCEQFRGRRAEVLGWEWYEKINELVGSSRDQVSIQEMIYLCSAKQLTVASLTTHYILIKACVYFRIFFFLKTESVR